jgi:hypothetical protein
MITFREHYREAPCVICGALTPCRAVEITGTVDQNMTEVENNQETLTPVCNAHFQEWKNQKVAKSVSNAMKPFEEKQEIAAGDVGKLSDILKSE